MDVQVGELMRMFWAPWRHGPGPAAERVSAGDPRGFGFPLTRQLCSDQTFEVGIDNRWTVKGKEAVTFSSQLLAVNTRWSKFNSQQSKVNRR